MDADEFRKRGKEMIDYVADYLSNIDKRRPMSDVKPGYMKELIRNEAPQEPDTWEDLMKDIEPIIMKGVTHWQSPHFHAYYPFNNSYPAILADLLSHAIGSNGFTWSSNPAGTELEVEMVNWLGKMLQLPPEFLFSPGGPGGGLIMSTASETTSTCLQAARTKFIRKIKKDNPNLEDGNIISKLVCYTSDQAHSSVEKAGVIGSVKMRILESDETGCLQGSALEAAVKEDKAKGLIPFFLCATLGTTASCAFDNIKELGPICKQDDIWMHIDAAYAGSAFICPEFRSLMDGVEFATSFSINVHKWLHVNFDCTVLWVQDSQLLSGALKIDALYLFDVNHGQMPDYTHWHVHLSRRFRSLKLWFVMRLYGQKKLQEVIRKDVRLAKEFEELVRTDDQFEITAAVSMGLVCFRLKGNNERNERLLKLINDDGRIHMVPGNVKGNYSIRFVICGSSTSSEHVQFAWDVILEITNKL